MVCATTLGLPCSTAGSGAAPASPPWRLRGGVLAMRRPRCMAPGRPQCSVVVTMCGQGELVRLANAFPQNLYARWCRTEGRAYGRVRSLGCGGDAGRRNVCR